MSCEDQGFTRIEDGCFVCLPDFDANGKPVRPKIVKRRERGLTVWACVRCGGNYGLVESNAVDSRGNDGR